MIRIQPYDCQWPAAFEAEAQRIQSALGATALRIEHVGSTSVPGLAAKPVIDIQVSVSDLGPMAAFCRALARIGYVHWPTGNFGLVYPFFQKPAAWPASHHVHLCVVGGEQERRHLAFRDFLRSHPAVAGEYLLLKQHLATVHRGDSMQSREAYSAAKSAFVESVLKRAIGRCNPHAA